MKPKWKDHPSLFVERSEVPGILAKAERYTWANDMLDKVRRSADTWLAKSLEFPPSTGRHSVTYICPECKEPLKTLSPTQHQCPECSKIYSGLPYDARLYGGQHSALASAASNLGLASLLFNKPAYARKALDILLGYAERYSAYPLIDNRGGQRASAARIFDQTLNDAIWLIDIAWAYDLVLGTGVGTPEEHRKVEEKLLRASVATIKGYQAGKSNWQSWHNAGMMAVAICLRDEQLLDEVLYGPNGFFFQMENSILPDGAWYEGSWSYHFYAIHALLRTAEAGYRSGLDLYTPQIKKALEAPLLVAMPDGRLPAIHDAESGHAGGTIYEYAAARYGDRIFQNVLAGNRPVSKEALLFGIEKPRKQRLTLSDTVLKNIGLAILRRGGQYVSMDFGPHGGGHGHLDKLSLNYYTAGQVFAPDLGRGWPYNLPVHQEWYKLTLSHNTVLVDGQPQKECEGTLESSESGREYDMVTALADGCYDGVKMRRTVALGDDWLLDVFDAKSDAEHTYDWVWHGHGEFETGLPADAVTLDNQHISYRYLTNVRQGDGARDWKATWKMDGGKIHALFKGSPNREALLCDAAGKPKTDLLASVILREKAKTCRFAALFSLRPMEWGDLPKDLQSQLR